MSNMVTLKWPNHSANKAKLYHRLVVGYLTHSFTSHFIPKPHLLSFLSSIRCPSIFSLFSVRIFHWSFWKFHFMYQLEHPYNTSTPVSLSVSENRNLLTNFFIHQKEKAAILNLCNVFVKGHGILRNVPQNCVVGGLVAYLTHSVIGL